MSCRALYLASCALAVLGVAYTWWALPAGRIPVHFGAGGAPDSWGSKGGLVAALGVSVVVLGVFLGWMAARLPRLSWEMVNLPRKEFWSRPENRERALARAQDDLYLTGSWMMWLLTGVCLLVVRAVNDVLETGSSDSPVLLLALGGSAALVAGVLWRQRWFRRNAED